MRILVVSNRFPPAVVGGYEVECSGVVERLRERHEVRVLTSKLGQDGPESTVVRDLALLEHSWRGTVRAPVAALGAARTTRAVLRDFDPDFVFIWNGSQIPQASLRVLADSRKPVAFRVCEHWFGKLFERDQFMRYLVGNDTHGPERVWGAGVRLVNGLLPTLKLDPTRPVRAAVSWNSEAIRRLAGVPPVVDVAFEDVIHSTSRNGPAFAAITRRPAPVPTILFLGRLWSGKGAWVAVRAVGRLRATYGISSRLLLAGPSDEAERHAIAAEVVAAGVEDLVEVLGPLGPDEVAARLAEAHVLVIPSVWLEPFPLVSIEGALARVPIVASDVGGIPEFLRDRVDALLAPPGDDSAFAAAFYETLTDSVATARRVDSAYAHAESLSWSAYLDASEQFVNDAFAALTA